MNDTVLRFDSCYGCGVCAIACPPRIIDIRETADGFYGPAIDEKEKCLHCGQCLAVCAYNDDRVADTGRIPPKTYAAWHKDSEIRQRCSSGGVGFAIAARLIGEGYRACGVRYNPAARRAEHFTAKTVTDFEPGIGSKYIPSHTFPGFSELNRQERFFVSGTPCQIDSLRRWLRKTKAEERYVLMDFFCHGVPSLHLWRQYLAEFSPEPGKIHSVSWRSKRNGWHDSWAITIESEQTSYFSPRSRGDLFFAFFLRNTCLGKACYDKCKYKMAVSAADIRIGDLWGRRYRADREGVSALLALTPRGSEVIDSLEQCHIEPLPLSVVTEGQMKKNPARPWVYRPVMRALSSGTPLTKIRPWLQLYLFSRLLPRIAGRIRYLLNI